MSDRISRRDFVVAATAAALTAAAVAPLVAQAADEQAGAPAAAIDVGPVSDYAADGVVNETWAKTKKFLVIHSGGRLIATSSLCTHKSCVVKSKDAQLACPCHGSRYSLEGKVQKGPSRASLVRYGISKGSDGRVLVDTSKRFSENQWDDPASFVKVDS